MRFGCVLDFLSLTKYRNLSLKKPKLLYLTIASQELPATYPVAGLKPMEQDDLLSSESVQETADYFDIDEHLMKKYQQLEDKIARLKIKFEAHKMTRGIKHGCQF
ncbi:hypothetical protein A6S26_32555 [Nostoc sp. ATCC 43529]|nr:hypothetical protein A6S26_32555 [Nostoc sp. ATCC 43529]